MHLINLSRVFCLELRTRVGVDLSFDPAKGGAQDRLCPPLPVLRRVLRNSKEEMKS